MANPSAVPTNTHDAIRFIERAGKYLVCDRKLTRVIKSGITATDAARNSNPDVQVLAIFSVVLQRITQTPNDGWVETICSILGLPEAAE